jgi:predicted RNA-binding protein with RPS1 domain
LKLSIKNLDYRINKKIRTKIKETPKGFNTLKEYLPVWIEEKLHKIDNN